MNRIVLFLWSLLLISQLAYSQNGDAIIWLRDGTVSNISVNMVSRVMILDSQGKGTPYNIIDSLATPDSSIANQIERLFPDVQVINRDKGYLVNFSLINSPKTIPVKKNDSFHTKQMVLVKLMNGESFEGEFIASNDSTATYQSNLGTITINKTMIFSLQPISSLSPSKDMKTSLETEQDIVRVSKATVAIKFCADLAGSHDASAMNQSGSLGVNTGISLGFEVGKTNENVFNFAFGWMYLNPREQEIKGSGKFTFMPIYAVGKIKLTQQGEGVVPMLIGNFGYNVIFYGDSNYKGPYNLRGGLYIAGGLRLEINKVFFEGLYKVFEGSATCNGYPDVDITFTTFSLSFGLLF